MAMENNENLQIQSLHSDVGWRAFLGLCAQRELVMREEELGNGHNFRATPLSPKNQQLLPSPRNDKSVGKRTAFDDESLLQKAAAKRVKISHELALNGMRLEEIMSIPPAAALLSQLSKPLQPPQAASDNSFLLNPAFLATGYANAAAAQQLILAQALASSGSMPSALKQQLNSIIASEISRLAMTATVAPTVDVHHGNEASLPATFSCGKVPPKATSPVSATTTMTCSGDTSSVASLDLGDEFSLIPGSKDISLCDCGMALCHEIGYPNRGTVAFPDHNEELLAEWCHRLDITSPQRLRDIQSHPSKFRLALWHFKNPSPGRQSIPDQSLQSFVDDVRASSNRHAQRKPTQRMLNLHRYWAQVRRPPTLEP